MSTGVTGRRVVGPDHKEARMRKRRSAVTVLVLGMVLGASSLAFKPAGRRAPAGGATTTPAPKTQ